MTCFPSPYASEGEREEREERKGEEEGEERTI
jgi:hypothetical protein